MVNWFAYYGAFGSIGMKSSSMTKRPILTKSYSTKSPSSSGSAKLLRRKHKSWTSKDTSSLIKLQLSSPSSKRVLLKIGRFDSIFWRLFINVRKGRNKPWFRTSALIRSPFGFSVIICRSFIAGSLKQARILILKEVFLKVKEFDISHIHCKDQKKTWENLFRNSTPIN